MSDVALKTKLVWECNLIDLNTENKIKYKYKNLKEMTIARRKMAKVMRNYKYEKCE